MPIRARTGEPLVRTRGLTVTFGGVRAVDGVDVDVAADQIVGLIGPKGAGKTTFIDAVTGFVPSEGEIDLAGQALIARSAHARARAGVVRTWQSLELFDELTVRENVTVGAEPAGVVDVARDILRPGRRQRVEAVDWALDLLDLAALADRRPAELPLGHQTLVGVARALAVRPSVVLLDEPAAGLDRSKTAALGARLRDVVETGTTVLLVDHDMGLVLDVCDDVYVLEFGRVIAHGRDDEIARAPSVVAAYLGSTRRAESNDPVPAPDV